MLNIVALGVLVWCVVFMLNRRHKVPEGQVVNDPLTTGEKISVWIMGLANPLISDIILYYGWKKKLPIKAKQANRISIWAFVIIVVLVILYVVLGGCQQ